MNHVRPGLRLLLASVCAYLLMVLTVGESGAGFEGIIADARSTGMGDCLIASNSGAVCLAPLPQSRARGAVNLSYCEPFGLEELAQRNLSCTAAFERSAVTLGLVDRGTSLYRERILSASVSGGPVASTRVSLCLGLYSMCLCSGENMWLLGLSAGARMSPVRWLEACMGFDNAAKSRDRGALPQSFLAGLVLRPVSDVTVAVEMRRNARGFDCLHVGTEFVADKGVRVRCGLQTEPVQLAAGLALEVGSFLVETATSFHPVLRRTDVLTLTWLGREEGP